MIINYMTFTFRRRCLQVLAYLVMAKQVIPTASQCKIGTYVERDIHTPEENMKFWSLVPQVLSASISRSAC